MQLKPITSPPKAKDKVKEKQPEVLSADLTKFISQESKCDE